ncbi:imm11 family protein [Halocynthiibacter sp.]|uniref:imm11 family protein n=1 Tax=Halocynthiibacter sp. TaxID=1979210 RepID=UPI003C6F5804
MEQRVDFYHFSQKYVKDLGPLEDYAQPKELKTLKVHKELASLIMMKNQLIAVDETLRDIIEDLEPGVHQFWPMKITMPKDQTYPVPYYGMVIHTHLASFRLEGSDPASARPDAYAGEGVDVISTSRSALAGLAMSREAADGKHIWREKHILRPWLFMSDELVARIKDAGLKMPKHYPMKAV